MMKAATDQPVQMPILPGQAGARPAQRARQGADQLLADFEGLLARQSMPQEVPVENTTDAPPDDQSGQQALVSPEILFLALAGGGEFSAPEHKAEEPETPDNAEKGTHPRRPDAAAPAVVAIVQEPLAVLAVPPMAEPPPLPPEAMKSEEPSVSDKTAMAPKTTASVAPPMPDEGLPDKPIAVAEPELPPAEDGHAAVMPAAEKAERRAYAITGEVTPLKDMGASQGPQPITLIRVAGQETHFAPSPVFLFDERKFDVSTLSAPAGADEPARMQAPPSPLAVKAPSGPLKTLTVQLGSHELGLINATVALKDKALDLRIGAARDDAVASLRENAGRLSETLQSLGFAVDGVSVQKMHQPDAGAQAGSGQSMQQGGAGHDGNGQGQQRDLNGSGFGSDGSARQSRHSSNDDHLAEQDGNDLGKSAGGTRNSRDVFL